MFTRQVSESWYWLTSSRMTFCSSSVSSGAKLLLLNSSIKTEKSKIDRHYLSLKLKKGLYLFTLWQVSMEERAESVNCLFKLPATRKARTWKRNLVLVSIFLLQKTFPKSFGTDKFVKIFYKRKINSIFIQMSFSYSNQKINQ